MLFNVFFIALIVFGILSLLTCTAFDVNTQQETREFLPNFSENAPASTSGG